MIKDSIPDIETQISNILNTKGKKYLTVNQIKNFLSANTLKHFKLSKKSISSKVLSAIGPYLGKSLINIKGPRSVYIGFNISAEKMILDSIKERPGISTKQLGNKVPLLKKNYISALNNLIKKGSVCCIVNELHTPKLEILENPEEIVQEKDIDKQSAFKAAYDEIGKGRNFVRIHLIREYLGWPDSEFNVVLEKLMADYIIELHGGDPSSLTEEQINNSYTDKKGFLYITLTWWGNKNE